MKPFFRIFIQGLILFIPLIITAAVLNRLFEMFSSLFSFIGISNSIFFNTVLGLIFTIALIFLMGLLASSFIFRQVFSYIEDKLEHAPFIRHIYSPVKDFTNAFVGNKRRFNRPVLVLTNPDAGIQEIGFVTREDLSELGITGLIAVYLPMSYSLSGRLLMVPPSRITPLGSVPADVMKFVVSGGVTDVDGE
jgi:uncharacterized membrane protein